MSLEPSPQGYHQPPPEKPLWKRLLLPIGGVLILLGKFKFLLVPIIKFFPLFLKTGGTMLLSIGVYAWIYGWQFGVGFVLLILVHEFGHLYAARRCGLKVGLPVFIPFMGAFIALKEAPPSAKIEAEVGIGGPYWGTGGAIFCLFLYKMIGWPILLVLAYTGFWLNLFNLIPFLPLDGGRIVAAVSPWLWVVGLVVLIGVMFTFTFNFIILFIILSSLGRVISFFRDRSVQESPYYDLSPNQRIGMGVQYFALAASLGFLMHSTHQQLMILHPGRF